MTQNSMPIWETAHHVWLPSLDGVVTADVCVVGLGGAGLSALEALADAGVDAVGLDAVDIGGGAAGRNGGFLLAGVAEFHHDAVERFGRSRAAALYRLTLDELDCQFATATPGLRRTGSLRIAADAMELDDCARHAEALRADGFEVEPYDGLEGCGLLFPRDGVFRPLEHWRAKADVLRARGRRLFGRSAARAIERHRVVTDRGEVRADTIIVAVDGGLERVLPELALRVRSARLQMLATAPLSCIVATRPVYYRGGLDYWQQLGDGRLALGGGRDIGGEAEWNALPLPDERVQSYLDALLHERFGLHLPVTHRWAAEVAYTNTGLPIFGELRPGVFVTGAYNGTGNVFGALCGRAIAQRSMGHPSALDGWIGDEVC